MVAAGIVEGVDVVMNEEPGFGMSSRDGAKGLCLEGGPERFHGGVVVAVGRSAHALDHAHERKVRAVLAGTVLATAVAVGDGTQENGVGSGEAGTLERFGSQFRAHVRGGGPAQDAAAVEVHDGSQIEPAFAGRDEGDVADPDLIRGGGCGAVQQQIGSSGCGGIGLRGAGGERSLLEGLETQFSHEPGNAFAGYAETLLLSEGDAQARGAVGLAAFMEGGGNLRPQGLIFTTALACGLAQVIVIAAAADTEGLPEFADLIAVLHGGNHREVLFWSRPMMAIAFFTMSR